MTSAETAAEFFDQLPPVGDVDHSVPTAWCARHWAPAPLIGANGMGANSDMLMIFAAEHCPPNMKSVAMFHRQVAKAGPVCCVLGDDRMYQLWARWQPASTPAPEPARNRPGLFEQPRHLLAAEDPG